MTAPMALLWLALLPFAGALALAAADNTQRRLAASLAGAVTLAALALVAATGPAVLRGNVLRWSVQWLPALGLIFGFRLGWPGLDVRAADHRLYTAYYLDAMDPSARFFMFLLLFMGAMLGVVLADNLVLLVVFWEATGEHDGLAGLEAEMKKMSRLFQRAGPVKLGSE